MQRIAVYQRNKSGLRKISAIEERGKGRVEIMVVDIDQPLPDVLDDSDGLLPSPADLGADLVLDYLTHPDLSYDLCRMCSELGIPAVSPTKKWRMPGVFTPPTCCGLPRHESLGAYGEMFGAPELAVAYEEGCAKSVRVVRGAPCGATWDAADLVRGLELKDASVAIGLKVQFYCSADPAGWDPIHGKSPVHFAGHIHSAAFDKAESGEEDQ